MQIDNVEEFFFFFFSWQGGSERAEAQWEFSGKGLSMYAEEEFGIKSQQISDLNIVDDLILVKNPGLREKYS